MVEHCGDEHSAVTGGYYDANRVSADDKVVECLDRVFAQMCQMSKERYTHVYDKFREAVWRKNAGVNTMCGRMFGNDNSKSSIFQMNSVSTAYTASVLNREESQN